VSTFTVSAYYVYMTDSMKDLLSKRGPSEPKEFQIIRKFVSDNFDEPITLSSRNNQIIIIVTNSAFAGVLQLHLHEIQKQLSDNQTVRIQIS
jgi:hypothetical protein